MDMTQARESFEKNGWLIFDPKLPTETIEKAKADQQSLFSKGLTNTVSDEGSYFQAGRIQDAWKLSAAAREIALSPYINDVLKQLYGRAPKAFQTLSFNVGTEQATHSDTIHFNSEPAGFMCGVWVALEDIDMDNGPLKYYTGSHTLSEWNMQHVDAEIPTSMAKPSAFSIALSRHEWVKHIPILRRWLPRISPEERYPRYEKFIAAKIVEHGLHPSYGVVPKGHALIWAANLLHGGSTRNDRSRTRHSQVTHYFFEDCRYYTPLLSTGIQKQWRTPEWVK